MAEGSAFWSYLDYGGNEDGESSTVSARVPVLTAANFDAQVALRDAVTAALSGVIVGATLKQSSIGNVVTTTSRGASNPQNQRETKWLVRYRDTVTGDKGRFEIPGADLSLLDPDAPGQMKMDEAEAVALVAAIEGYFLSPLGNAIEVTKIIHVGRNT